MRVLIVEDEPYLAGDGDTAREPLSINTYEIAEQVLVAAEGGVVSHG